VIKLVVGLGNPGPRYAHTRHNVGFMVADELARRLRVGWTARPKLDLAEARVGTGKLYLMKPRTYMNLSGVAVAPFARFHKLDEPEILVVHDDLDLPLGRLRLRLGGSGGGQNGVADVIRRLGSDRFGRLKLGVSRPPAGWTSANWVLSGFAPEEGALLSAVVAAGADAVYAAARDGLLTTQNEFNGLDLRPPAPPAVPGPPEPEATG
jgi:PTH1 family peptidyl-tRNA hydrolase